MIVRDPQTDEFVGIACDTCRKEAPAAVEISRGHGLNNMGWQCAGGTHICDDCPHRDIPPINHPAVPARGRTSSTA